MRRIALALVLVMVAAGCSDPAADTTEPSQFPTGSVRSWFDSLQIGDTTSALQLTYEPSMLVVVAAENGLETSLVASLLRRGATAESAAGYMDDFGAALRERFGRSLSDISVDGFTEVGETYAAVTVTGDGAATIITRRAPGGLWQVDFAGTLGPALITQVRSILEAADDGEDGDTIRDVFAADVLPALEAASVSDPQDLTLASEIRLMRRLLEV